VQNEWRMQDVRRALLAANEIGISFLIVELDTAMTFMDLAASTGVVETARRNRGHARDAYEVVMRLLPRVTPDEAQRGVIARKLAKLKARLEAEVD
jgi:hypothetical protein